MQCTVLHLPVRFGLLLGVLALLAGSAVAQLLRPVGPEVRQIRVRDPSELPRIPIPDLPPPATVTDPQDDAPAQELSLDDAIRIALDNAEVVRVLSGVSASSSGRTLYDAAVVHSTIEEQKARFDPQIDLGNTFSKTESGFAFFDPMDPSNVLFGGSETGGYNLNLNLSQTNPLGGTLGFGLGVNALRFGPDLVPLDPQTDTSMALSYVQPLLNGAGTSVNIAPIVLATIDTERSYFQLKDAVQELVRGVIDGYWSLVFARTDLWARRQQTEQAAVSLRLTEARRRAELADIEEVAQARLALANFRANQIAAEANLLQREAALRNVLGLPPSVPGRLIPTTPPVRGQVEFDWRRLLELAEQYRPDIIELKLVLEADRQQWLLANNAALPNVDAVAQYQWNGLEGTTPGGQRFSVSPGTITDWSLGVTFAVPLGLRAARARLRQRELILAADRAHLEQAMHNATHVLALTLRQLEQAYQQYLAYRETRAAAQTNLELQHGEYRAGRVIFLNVLQAITDWGNAVSAEAQALTQYNTTLATMERQTGTILEVHGVRFYEERYESIGPAGRLHDGRLYPRRLVPTTDQQTYETGEGPAEATFDLLNPLDQVLPDLPPRRLPNLE